MAGLAFRLWYEEEGQGVVEYALILVLIALVAVISMKNLAVAAGRAYSGAADRIVDAYTRTQPSNDRIDGSGQGGWSQSGAGSSFPIQNDVTNNFSGSSTR